ncbi:hypothetical protein [Mesorhizobium sp. M1328]|uniref:hypothetical protein n=1 Tax=Mesorhizobium sp. M1328 TaxID=2957082 RepID=UPI00333D9183
MIAEHLGQIIEVHVAGVENRPEMIVENIFETIAPFVAGEELHQTLEVVAVGHGLFPLFVCARR